MASVNGEFALVTVTHERATDLCTLSAGDAGGKHKRRSAPGESCMNRFSDAGSTPAVSSPEGRAANLGLSEVENCSIPTTVEFVRCVGCSSTEGRAVKLGLHKLENYSIPRPRRISVERGYLAVRKHRYAVFFHYECGDVKRHTEKIPYAFLLFVCTIVQSEDQPPNA